MPTRADRCVWGHEADDRAREALRAWIRAHHRRPPGARVLDQIIDQVAGARADATPMVRWSEGVVRRHRGTLALLAATPAAQNCALPWRPGSAITLADGSVLLARIRTGVGVAVSRLDGARVRVVFRRGGERCRPAPGARSRTLKNLLREHRVPPWLRPRMPLLEVDGRIAAVPGICVVAGFAPAPGEPGWELRWSAWCGPWVKPNADSAGLE